MMLVTAFQRCYPSHTDVLFRSRTLSGQNTWHVVIMLKCKIFPLSTLTVITLYIFTGCAFTTGSITPDLTSPGQYQDRQHAVHKTTDDGLYHVSLFSNAYPIPLKTIHSWTVHIESAAGLPASKLKVYVFGGMPAHRHDFPTKPVVSEHLGNGDYRVDGIKFNMPGLWEMRFTLQEGGKRDRVVFTIEL